MPTYVDPLMNWGGSSTFRWKYSCHLIADTEEELHAFARKLQLRREWAQTDSLLHYDLTESKRNKAVELGAKQISLYDLGERIREDQFLSVLVPEVTKVVDTIVGRTATVYKILPRFGVQVFVKERGYERENWPFRQITIRSPRLVRRWPRPFRWPREEPTKQCHCRIGRMELENAEERAVRCQRCKQLVGSESYPRRIERAEIAIRKELARNEPKNQVQEGVRERGDREEVRGSKVSFKRRKKSPSRMVVRPKRRSNAKRGNSKTRSRAPLPKRKRKPRALPAHRKVPKVLKKNGKKAGPAQAKGRMR